jgi:hypothetical protein
MTTRTCIGDGGVCGRPAIKRDMCNRHYLEWRRNTPPAEQPTRRRLGLTDLERFYTHVNKMGPVAKNNPELGRCHIWKDGKTRGYGIFWAEGTSHRAHVWIYKKTVAPVPDGLDLDHFACDRTECVNVAHERPATQRENILRSGGGAAINAAKMKCPKGHDLDESNTRINAKGARECLTCKRTQQRQMRQAERALKAGYVPLPPESTICPAEHDLTAEDAAYTYHGQLVCLICTAPKGKGGRHPAEFSQGRRVA